MKQVVIVSGGSKGLGQAIVADLLAKGKKVATFSRSQTDFIEQQIEQDPEEKDFLYRQLDVTDHHSLHSFVMAVAKKYGHIDALVNNAGIAVSGVLPLMRAEDIQQVIDINLLSAIKLTQSCARIMLLSNRGVILNISSIIGSRGYKGLSVYSATKAGLNGFTCSLARELGCKGIRVNAIAPGYIDTEMSSELSTKQKNSIIARTPLGKLAEMDDILGAIRFLLSPESSFITGQILTIDGGLTC